MKKALLYLAVLLMTVSLCSEELMAQGNNSPAGVPNKKNRPFLITGRMPHLTRLIKQQWNNPALQLTRSQKEQLLAVRKETIAAVTKLSSDIEPLEQQVARGIFSGKTPEKLRPLVQTVADLKAEATMVHLRCISRTEKIMDPEQLTFLKELAKNRGK